MLCSYLCAYCLAGSMAAVLAGLKSVDFYRKLKRDLQQELTEASIAGAALSVCAAIFMIGLVIAEFRCGRVSVSEHQ